MSDVKRGIFRYMLQTVLFIAFFGVCLFISAGRLDWTMGWVWLGLNAAGQIVTALFLWARNPALMGERASIQEKRDWGRVLGGVMALFGPAAICIVGGLDLRLGWLPDIYPTLQLAGVLIAAAGAALTVWAMTSNRFFYGTIRIAREKGQTVCDAGPYRFIRHPGYMGAIVFDLASPLVLHSAWGFIPAAVTVIAIAVRTAIEDKTLQAGLDGYREYAGRVRSRLLPFVW